MAECLQYIFCCFDWSDTRTQTGENNSITNPSKKKIHSKPKPKPSRILSKYRPQQTIQVQKQDKKKGKVVYTCPICTVYYNSIFFVNQGILACNQCDNHICRSCAQAYQKKFELNQKQNMKCPFCNSETSNFIDYEEAARSYFDTTGKNGFLDPAQRKKIDQEMKMAQSGQMEQEQNNRSMQLYRIQQDQTNENHIPSGNHIGSVDNYVHIEVRRNQNSLQAEQQNQERERQQSSIANLRQQSNILVVNHEPRPQMSATV